MEKEVRKSFLEYSMSVIVSRALPDVRDGMKPGQRRILYAMYEDNLTHDKPFRKSATTVGDVLGRYHPHGDAAVYGTMVRMAQDFSYRYPLVEGHGNFGSIDGDGAAAYRYTEARMAKISDELMRDIEKDVVPMVPNFDNRRKEPSVLPSRFPNLLVNGSVGIAVGMATNIPPHNLGEVIDGAIYLMENPEATVPELMKFVKGPDFPTGATIYGTSGIYEAYMTGRGRVMVRANAEIEEDKHRIIVTEIPYMVNKAMLVASIADLVKDKRVEGITNIWDESGRNGMRIVIECRRDANCQVILNQLYKYSQLQDTCAMNMLALANGEPKVLGLRDILNHYITHQESVITRRTEFELKKALREAHLYEGYKIAIDNIDEVISIIRASADTATAKENLKERFKGDGTAELDLETREGLLSFASSENAGLSDEQAQAIVTMPLGRLSGLERQKIENKLAEISALVVELRSILADENKVKAIIKDEMLEIKRKFADERKTDIVEAQDEILLEDLIERHKCVITMSHEGYIKRQPADVYTAQRRGGKGIIGMTSKEDDFIENVITADSHSHLMLFTDTGRVQVRKAYQIPEASRTAKGTNIVNVIDLESDEKLTAILSVDNLEGDDYLVMVTRGGVVKRTPISEFSYQRKGGKIAINLDDGDRLCFVARTKGDSDILIASHNGLAARFNEDKVTIVGRTARGVRGIRLKEGDYVVGAVIIENNDEWQATNTIAAITENGYGKRINASQFDAKGRGIQGVICQNVTEKTGALCGISIVNEEEDLLLITDTGTIIRTPAAGIPVYGRTASGVIVMRLSDGAKLINFTTSEKTEEDDNEAPEEVEASEAEAESLAEEN
ncbi:MAG: DNA gyrase subunit A [Clostridia bacterium]|nr:DNA gyrase subunit A [Clostridia bacterium]